MGIGIIKKILRYYNVEDVKNMKLDNRIKMTKKNAETKETKKNAVTIGYKIFEFPEYHSESQEMTDLVKTSCLNDPKLLLEFAAKMYLERTYFHDMLLFIQAKLERHSFNAEPLGLCLDSSKDLFDIMITPCDIIKKICPYCKEDLVMSETDKMTTTVPIQLNRCEIKKVFYDI